MKKLIFSLCSVCLVIVLAFSLVGCKPKEYSATTTDTSKVQGNGGTSVVYNSELYFINGQLSNNGENNGGKTIGSIYKVPINQDGSIAEDAKYTKVVDSLVGYDDGSINIIGDFLYYTTPSSSKNNKGTILYHKVKFMRYDLKKNLTQELYVTNQNSEEEEVTFSFYKMGDTLNLLVFEKSNATLTSLKIDSKVSTNFQKTSVTSAVFSENYGESKTQSVTADNYVFYTKAVEAEDTVQTGNKVFKIKADGTDEELISDGITYSLLCIRAGKLLFTATFDSNTYIYAYKIDETTKNGDIAVADSDNYATPNQESFKHIVSYNSYEQVVFLEDGEDIEVLCIDSTALCVRLFKYIDGKLDASNDKVIYTFPTGSTISFVDTYSDNVTKNGVTAQRDYVIFTNTTNSTTLLYKLRYNSDNLEEQEDTSISPEKLSTSGITESSGNMIPRIVNNYVYVFVKDDDKNTLMYQINCYTPKEIEEQFPSEEAPEADELKVGKAQLVGGSEI